MAQNSYVVCDNLVKIYKVAELEVVALQGLDLVVNSGELVGIVGASGSGKSTLMNVLGGLDRPSAGRVWVGGQDLLKLSDIGLDRYRRSKVGFVWQQGARNLIPYLTAQENVELPMTLVGFTGRKRGERAKLLLETVGLTERRHHHLSEMSGGEQQRVAIAVALSNNPPMLLADEPTGEVDSTTASMIYQILRDLNRNFGLTILIVSHDQGIARHVDRVVAIRDGKLASETIRKPSTQSDQNEASQPDGTKEGQDEAVYEELTVLDSAGRLQVPKAYLEHYHFKGRARLEPVEDGILIRAVAPNGNTATVEQASDEIIQNRPQSGLRRLLHRIGLQNPKDRRPE
jgi:putative ABC transport system ATP-binding protein